MKNNSNKEYLDNIKSVTELMRSILLQFSNKSQYTIPLSFGIKEDNQYIFLSMPILNFRLYGNIRILKILIPAIQQLYSIL